MVQDYITSKIILHEIEVEASILILFRYSIACMAHAIKVFMQNFTNPSGPGGSCRSQNGVHAKTVNGVLKTVSYKHNVFFK